MKPSFVLFIFFTGTWACTNTPEKKTAVKDSVAITFDAKRWKIKDDKEDSYPNRDKMLHDLVYNKLVGSGLSKDSVVGLLGDPDRIDSNYFFYRIAQERAGFFPLHTKTMVIKLSADTLEWVKIHQ